MVVVSWLSNQIRKRKAAEIESEALKLQEDKKNAMEALELSLAEKHKEDQEAAVLGAVKAATKKTFKGLCGNFINSPLANIYILIDQNNHSNNRKHQQEIRKNTSHPRILLGCINVDRARRRCC